MNIFQSDVNGDGSTRLLVWRSVFWPDGLLGRRLGNRLVRHGGEKALGTVMTAVRVVVRRETRDQGLKTAGLQRRSSGWVIGAQVLGRNGKNGQLITR